MMPPSPTPNAPPKPSVQPAPPHRGASGLWSLDGDRLASVAEAAAGLAVVLVPTEQVLLLTVALPLPTRAKRVAALPFAIEGRIAEPIEAVHVALGAEVAPGRFLVGVVRHAAMRQWVARLGEAGLVRAALVPDAVGVPVPGEGSWSLDLAAGRAMVRRDDASGFALPVGHLEAAWLAAGQPPCIAYGAPPPEAIAAASAPIEAQPLAARLTAPALDLRQGAYARPRRAVHPLWRRIAAVAAIGAGAHAAIAAADVIALSRIASGRAVVARAALARAAPGLAVGDDLAAAAAAVAPAGDDRPAGAFLPLTVRAARALQPLGTPVAIRSLAFDGAAGTLALDVEAADIAGLQRVAAALTGAGLTAEAGAAAVDDGRAVGTFTVRAP